MKRAIVILGLILAFSITTSKLQQRFADFASQSENFSPAPSLALNSARASSPRAKVKHRRRMQQVRMMATALELPYNDLP